MKTRHKIKGKIREKKRCNGHFLKESVVMNTEDVLNSIWSEGERVLFYLFKSVSFCSFSVSFPWLRKKNAFRMDRVE